MSVNVNRSVLDQFYRYKMPRLIAKVGPPPPVSIGASERVYWSVGSDASVFPSRWKAKEMASRRSLSTWWMLPRL